MVVTEIFRRGRKRYGVGILGEYFTDKSFPGETFDLIFSLNVFEHLLNPADILQVVRRKLKPNGYLYIFIPTFRGCYRKLTWIQFGSPHTVMFTHKTMGNLLTRTGYRMVKYAYHVDGELRVLAQPAETSKERLYIENWRLIPMEIYLQGLKYYMYYPVYAIARNAAKATRGIIYASLGKRVGEYVVQKLIALKSVLRVNFY